MMKTRISPPRNKPMIVAGLSFYILFAVLVVLKNHLLNMGGEWTNSQVFDDVFMLGFFTCWLVLCIGYTYYAWKLNANDFLEWMKKQTFMSKKQLQRQESEFARDYTYWFFRYITPLGVLFGITAIGFNLLSIIRYLLK